MNIGQYILANSYSAFSPLLNVATQCPLNEQGVPCASGFLDGLFLGGFFVFFTVIWLAVGVLILISTWKIYMKAGQPGWAAIVPIYYIIVLLRIVKKPTWWTFLYFVPLVNIVISLIITHNLSKVFGKDISFTLGLIFLPFIFFPILAFGKPSYIGQVTPQVAPMP
ncbi:MAG TPA: DUF5684 domain-containing protein [Candidatus Paceibacterota bacterium]